MLFDAVVASLGDSAVQETANSGAIRRLFRRDPADRTQIVPWPVLELNVGARFDFVTDWMPVGDAPFDGPAPTRATPPRLRGLGPGEIRLADGAEHIEIVYDDAGAKLETCRSNHPRPLAGLAPALAETGGNPVELLARFLAALDPSRHGPGRVWMPAAMPKGVGGVWRVGLGALRRALFAESAAAGARWAVADGASGTALGFGATRDAALSQWRAAVAARSPWPEPQPAPELPPDLPPDAMVITGPSSDVAMPAAVNENVPAVLVPLAPAPADTPAFGSWTTLLGAHGDTLFAACRRKRRGFTAIGQHVLGAVDLAQLPVELDRVDAEHEERLREIAARRPEGLARRPCRTTVYQVHAAGRLAFDGSSEDSAWHAGGMDGDVIARRVVRQRWVDG